METIQRISPFILLIFSSFLHSVPSNSNNFYTWKLDFVSKRILPSDHLLNKAHLSDFYEDENSINQRESLMYEILISTVIGKDGIWKKTPESQTRCSDCHKQFSIVGEKDFSPIYVESLDCGKPVNLTYYDHLLGIQNRHKHPSFPEPSVILFFKALMRSKKKNSSELHIDSIENLLKKFKGEKPKSVELYNQIGNFWRVKGNTQKSIECFRRALAVSPNNAEILLNLGTVLFNLQFLDDAIFLTRRSLEVQPPDQNAWQQHFQLGEILKAYSHYQEATLHLRHVLELKPNYGPAVLALQEMEFISESSVHLYTVLIILCLVVFVIFWIVSTLDLTFEEILGTSKESQSKSIKRLRHRTHKG